MVQTAIARKLEVLRLRGGIKSADLAELLSTTPETVSRWNAGRSSPHRAFERKILDLEYIVECLREFYADPNDARLWLFSPQKLLDGKKPADLIEEGKIEKVRAFIKDLGGVVDS